MTKCGSEGSCCQSGEKQTPPACCQGGVCTKTAAARSSVPSSAQDNTSTRSPSCCGAKADATSGLASHENNRNNNGAASICLAVVRENGADIVVFDASGRPRTFSYKGDIRKLCFNTHGANMADDLLTPCFDEEGNHGLPEESCFCGVDTPHLHAHLRDSCGSKDEEEEKENDKKKASARLEDNVGLLATHILHPTDDNITGSFEDGAEFEDVPLHNIGVTDSMPNECNSEQFRQQMSDTGIASTHTGLKHRRRMHKVQHDDHVDYLVHNSATGELHLEHPCDDCGERDVHGNFRQVGRRRLKREGDNDIQIHFFEVAPRPFNIIDFFHDAFQLDSDRVNAVDHILEKTPTRKPKKGGAVTMLVDELLDTTPRRRDVDARTTTVRSTFKCTQICCAAEVPLINDVLEPLPGVEKVMINVPLKQVIVDHGPDLITATDIAAALNKNRFGATIKRDGAEGMAQQPTGKGRSQFYVQGICCASEIPAINSVIEPMEGVSAVSINVTTKSVYVDHDTGTVSAQQICDALNKESFGADIRHDAATTAASARFAFVKSTLTFEHADPDITEALTAFLRTFDSSQMESFIVDVPTKTITVVHNPFSLSAQAICDALRERTDIDASISFDGADPEYWKSLGVEEEGLEDLEDDERITLPKVTVILSGLFWIVSMLSYVGGNWVYLKYVAIVSVAFGIPPIALKAFRTLRRFQFDTNCLMFFAAVGALALQEFTEAAAVVFLFAISEWLEVRATTRARRALSAIVQLRPDRANLIHPSTQELIVVPASSIPVGALVSVMTGDKIPCDGIVVEGHSTVDESSLTGESRPIRKGPDDKVSGGTVNSGMVQLMVKTTSTAENSAVSRLVRLVEEAQANRSDTEKLVDEFAKIYTPVVVLAAILMCSIPWAFGSDVGRQWTNNGLILIVVACPCALIISTPVSYVAGLAATAQKGVLIKGGANLEALGLVKNICFDKTGTLTNGEFSLLHMNVLSTRLSRTKVFQYLSLMEERASHPVAQAILVAAKNENVVLPKDMILEKHTIISGEGVVGVINGLEVHVGNERLFERLGLLQILSESDRQQVETWKSFGGTIGYMSIEGEGIVCAYCAADGVRDESADVVSNLRRMGISVQMLTGDNRDAAHAIGSQVGLADNEIMSKLLPEEKLNYVEGLSEGRAERSLFCSPIVRRELVMMCGDGVNDAPALAAANVGVAMGAGAALAMETADVTLLDSNLEKLEYSIRMGRRVIRKIVQNVVFSLAVKLVVLGFALAGMTNLWAAIGSDVGAMILVTLNAMLLLPARQRSSDVLQLKDDIEEAVLDRTTLAREGTGFSSKSTDDEESRETTDLPCSRRSECSTACGAAPAGTRDVPHGCCSKSTDDGAIRADEACSQKSKCATGCCALPSETTAVSHGCHRNSTNTRTESNQDRSYEYEEVRKDDIDIGNDSDCELTAHKYT